MKKTLLFIGVILVLILGMLFAIIWHYFIREPLLHEPQATSILMPPGTGIEHLTTVLQRRGFLQHPKLFIFFATLTGSAKRLKVGEYEIKPNMTALDLLNNIVSGHVLQRSIIFIEGKTFSDIKQVLNSNPYLKHKIVGLSDAQIMQQLNYLDQYPHPEGLFFPATYYFTWGDTDIMVLRKAYAKMQQVLNEAWQKRADNLPYHDPYEALIVASLVERETARPEERAQIAGVIVRRLQQRMLLQVDPTILYGLGLSYRTAITKADLLTDTPYNTYRHYGLPPTPIGMPGLAAIDSALHPVESDALYYVARGDGSHIFSATYRDHQAAIAAARLITAQSHEQNATNNKNEKILQKN